MTLFCELCNMTFVKPHKYEKHQKDVHSIKTTFNCTKCEYTGPSYRYMREHMKECNPEPSEPALSNQFPSNFSGFIYIPLKSSMMSISNIYVCFINSDISPTDNFLHSVADMLEMN